MHPSRKPPHALYKPTAERMRHEGATHRTRPRTAQGPAYSHIGAPWRLIRATGPRDLLDAEQIVIIAALSAAAGSTGGTGAGTGWAIREWTIRRKERVCPL